MGYGFWSSRYNANNPSEDRTVVAPGVIANGSEPGGDLEGVSIASVLDGHAGWQVKS